MVHLHAARRVVAVVVAAAAAAAEEIDQVDRVGLGWRTEIAPSILSHLDQIDIVEVILDDYLKVPKSKLQALRTLSAQVPVLYHGVGLGLATSFPLDQDRLSRLAIVLDYLAPDTWSEHLSFVRAGKIEIGHLAAPPRNLSTVNGALENLERVKKIVGSYPALENIATLIEPPGSTMSEGRWTGEIIRGSGCKLLLDLHNLYANAVNFGSDPFDYLHTFPLEKVQLVHLSGGRWVPEPIENTSNPGGRRLLDDHIHDVPEPVFELLDVLARTVSQPLSVIIERDGEYPEFNVLLDQIHRTKNILKTARQKSMKSKGGFVECANA